jgi:hypothetical protein
MPSLVPSQGQIILFNVAAVPTTPLMIPTNAATLLEVDILFTSKVVVNKYFM